MKVVSLTGNDTVIINGRILNDFADGDVAKIEYPNEIMTVKRGKNGNSMFALNAPGEILDCEIKLIRGGADDQFLNDLLTEMKQNPPAFVLLSGEFVKNVGDGAGNIGQEIYNLNGGVFKKNPAVKENVEGETEQATVTYTLVFSDGTRTIG